MSPALLCFLFRAGGCPRGGARGAALLPALAFVIFGVSGLQAEPFSASFKSNAVPANAFLVGSAVVNSETLKLTTRPSGIPPFPTRVGSFVVDDLAAGGAINQFTVTFNALISGGPGEGLSFCWGPGLPTSGAGFGEEGPAGFQGLVVAFDTTDNDGDGAADAVAIDLIWQGALVVRSAVPAATLRPNAFVPVVVTLSGDVVRVKWNGVYYVNESASFPANRLPNFAPVAGARFGWGARNRSSSVPQDNHWLDDLAITFPLPALSLGRPSATSTTATLKGIVDPSGSPADWFFEYGTSAAYGSQTPVQKVSELTNVSAQISGLTPGTTYHYRLVSSNAGGTTETADATFTPIFSQVPGALGRGAGLPGLGWGDYDNDGDLDLIFSVEVAPFYDFEIARNNGGGNYTPLSPMVFDLRASDVAWGDYDNDGDLDLAFAGRIGFTFTRLTQIRRNDGGSTFTNIQAGLPGMDSGALAWGDYDNDGDLDLALCGSSDTGAITRIYRNDGDNVFTDLAAGLPGASYLAWGDYDNDDDLDLALAGGSIVGTQIRRNDGGGAFTLVGTLPQFVRAWGDFDNDGDLDLASLNGSIVRNDGGGLFTEIQAGLPSSAAELPSLGSLAWGDYDNDGDIDLAIGGKDAGTRIGRNDGNGIFSAIDPAMANSRSLAWGDHDNDGDLDLVAGNSFLPMQLQTNGLSAPNIPPSAPTQLAAGDTATQIIFSWAAPLDDHTPAAGLTYNLRVGTAPALGDVLAAPLPGRKRLPEMGAQQTGTTARLTLPAGTYYWTVQAVDTAFEGGPWAQEQTYAHSTAPTAVTQGVTDSTESGATLLASINPNGQDTSAMFEFGLTPTYGSSSASVVLGDSRMPVPHRAVVSGLAADSIYHFRARASNALGEGNGADMSFRTLAFTAAPARLTATLAPERSAVVPATLTNHTGVALTVGVSFQAPAPSWAAAPASRNVPAGGTAAVNIFFDATGLPAGSQQQATLHFDAGGGRVAVDVPVTLYITAPAFAGLEFLSGGAGVRLTWNWAEGQTSTVQVSENLADWASLGTTMETSPGVFQITDPEAAGKPRRFYRLIIGP